MAKVYAIKFQEVQESVVRCGDRDYKTKYIGIKDKYYLKYFHRSANSEFLVWSDNYWEKPDVDTTEDTTEFSFDTMVQVVGYSTDVPLIIHVRGEDRAVLMPNYIGTPEILPIHPLISELYGKNLAYIFGIAGNMPIKIKAGDQ